MLNSSVNNIFHIKQFNKLFSAVIFVFTLIFFSIEDVCASVGDRVRGDIRYNQSTQLCDKEQLKFDPFFTGNPDVNWEISNPVCLTLMATSVAVANLADYLVTKQCSPADPSAEVNAALKASFFNPALLMIGVAKNGGMCGSYTSICAFNPDPVTKAAACQFAMRCCAGWGAQIASYGALVGSFAIVYKVAKDAYEDARICGHNWLSWKYEDGLWKKGVYEGSRAYEVSNLAKKSSNNLIGDQYYREFIYGGVEYEDNSEGACKNPTGWDHDTRMKYLGYSSNNQRYYMKGAKETPSFACYRFLVGIDKKSEADSFECCQNRSQNTICIERNGYKFNDSTWHRSDYKFCKIGDNKCSVWGNGSSGAKGIEGEVYYNIYESRKNAGYICAETYSVCPYNHPLGGGTEDMSSGSNADGNPNTYNIGNYCQYMYHCSKIPNKLYFKTSNLTGSFISQSCRDMKGDSQNNYNSTASIIGTNSFSSAIVQCFKETLENAFFNKAGYTKCVDANEEAKNGLCDSGYIQRKGDPLLGDSFFIKIQKKLKDVIKILLTLSVIFLGGKIAMGEEINKKLIFGYIAKIAVIIYFVIGDAWQAHFMKGVMDSSNFLAGLMFSSDYDLDAKKAKDTNKSDDINFLDGCQFPRYNYANSSDFNNPKYAPGNEYLKMWDTLDCKIARAIGMAPGATTANIILTILAGFFTGGLGILFVIAVLAFAIFLIHLVIQAFHMFLVSMLAIIILIFVSPITITMALFDKTKNIFDSWLSELLGYAFQPMIIYAYLGIFIALFDSVIVGRGMQFSGDGKYSPKNAMCQNQDLIFACGLLGFLTNSTDFVKDASLTVVTLNNAESIIKQSNITDYTNKSEVGRVCEEARRIGSTSIYCIFGLTKVQNYTGFEALSIGIPQLVGLIDNKLAIITILKSAFLFIIFSFAGAKIPDLARALVGGSSVDGGNWSSAGKAFGQLTSIYSSIRSTQQKGMGMARKFGSSVNNARRDYRYNLDQNSNKKDQAISGDKSGQPPQENQQTQADNKLVGGSENAVGQIQQSQQVLPKEPPELPKEEQKPVQQIQQSEKAQKPDKKENENQDLQSFSQYGVNIGHQVRDGMSSVANKLSESLGFGKILEDNSADEHKRRALEKDPTTGKSLDDESSEREQKFAKNVNEGKLFEALSDYSDIAKDVTGIDVKGAYNTTAEAGKQFSEDVTKGANQAYNEATKAVGEIGNQALESVNKNMQQAYDVVSSYFSASSSENKEEQPKQESANPENQQQSQQEIQSNKMTDSKSDISRQNSKNNKSANKINATLLNNSSLILKLVDRNSGITGSRKIEKLGLDNASGYLTRSNNKNLKESESLKFAFQEVAMWGSKNQIEILKNNHFGSNPTKSEEKSFYEKLTKAREDYLENNVLKERDLKQLEEQGLTTKESKEMMKGIYAKQKSIELKKNDSKK